MRAVVTGSHSGIGASVVAVYRGLGWDVIGLDLSDGHDVTSRHQMDDDLESAWPFDVLVNCAGVAGKGEFEFLSDFEIERVMDVNFWGVANTCRRAGRIARNYKRPLSIVNVASMSGLVSNGPGFHNAHYGASKAAVLQLTRSLAVEWAPLIRVNAVAPGPIDTPMLQGFKARDPERYAEFVGRVPLGRPGRPAEVASAVVWLAGATFCTGSTLIVDGGYTAQ